MAIKSRFLGAAVVGMAALAVFGGNLAVQPDGIVFPDGTLQETAAPADPRRGFYLTQFAVYGDQPLAACAPGYHFASLFEILEVSNLRYAEEHTAARVTGDSGAGPPSGLYGWVRTGQDGNPGLTDPGFANCGVSATGPDLAWATRSAAEMGTRVRLEAVWEDQGQSLVSWLGPWLASADDCASQNGVWCVQD